MNMNIYAEIQKRYLLKLVRFTYIVIFYIGTMKFSNTMFSKKINSSICISNSKINYLNSNIKEHNMEYA